MTIEQALAKMANILTQPMPEFTDDYARRAWDAAQFRVYGRTRGDQVAEWHTAQAMQLYSAGGAVERAIQDAQVRPGYTGNIAEPRRFRMLSHAAQLYAGGMDADAAIAATCTAFPRW